MSCKEDMTIRFSGLKSGVYTYDFMLGREFFEEWKIDEIEDGNVKIHVEMERQERMLLFTFVLKGEVTVPCDRCLAPMAIPIDGEEHLSVSFSDTETTLDEQQLILPEDATEIDLSQQLYEYVAVQLPLFRTHPDGDCDPEVVRHIADPDAPRPEGDIDPRWEALKKLK